jgi:membrane protease YdiL (CAAX protease family)
MKNTELILILVLSYTIMLLMTVSISRLKPGITLHHKLSPGNFRVLNYLHTAGIVTMLIIPCMDALLPPFLFSFPDKISIVQIIIFLFCFFAIAFFPWRDFSDKNHKDGDTVSSLPSVLLYGSLRSTFLVSYEWFFRGLLLWSFSLWLGVIWSILINVLLYTLIHIHKNKNELIGCIPFGLLVCVFTLWWQSIWPAIIFHLEIMIIHEWPILQKFISPQKQAAS